MTHSEIEALYDELTNLIDNYGNEEYKFGKGMVRYTEPVKAKRELMKKTEEVLEKL